MTDTQGFDYQVMVEAIHLLFDAAMAVYVYVANKNKATNDKIDAIVRDTDEQLSDHSDRLARLEVSSKALPTHQDMGAVHTRINEMSHDVSTMSGEIKAMRHTLQLIQQHLLSGGGRP